MRVTLGCCAAARAATDDECNEYAEDRTHRGSPQNGWACKHRGNASENSTRKQILDTANALHFSHVTMLAIIVCRSNALA